MSQSTGVHAAYIQIRVTRKASICFFPLSGCYGPMQLSKPHDTWSRCSFIKPRPDIEDEAIQWIGFRASEVTAHECRPASKFHHGNAQMLKSS